MPETQQRNNSNNNRNRNNRNRNNRHRSNRNNDGNRGPNPNRSEEFRPKQSYTKSAPKLTLWQKILSVFGLYKPAAKAAPQRPQNRTEQPKQANQGERKNSGDFKKNQPQREPREPREPRERTPASSARLYIGNLSFDATESDIEDLFKGVGSVRRVEIVYHRQTHRSRGYGFLEMGSFEEAKRAVEVLHDQPFMGRKLVVNGAKAKNAGDDTQDEAPMSEERPQA